jgi:hypothetical protein
MNTDKFTLKSTGVLHLDADLFLNSAVATTMTGATISGSVTAVVGPHITLSINITPGAPIATAVDQVDYKPTEGRQ